LSRQIAGRDEALHRAVLQTKLLPDKIGRKTIEPRGSADSTAQLIVQNRPGRITIEPLKIVTILFHATALGAGQPVEVIRDADTR
jgi:hypothetical protein